MFARRRSSVSLLNDKYSCLNVALLTCCLAVVIGNVTSISLDRVAAARQARQFQQQNDKQLEFSEFIVPEAESEFLQNDIELVPVEDGQSDMYLLVPAVDNSQQQIDEQLEHDNAENNANVENNSDMLMLESDDSPAVQTLEMPKDILEAGQNVHNENNDEEEDDQIAVNELDNLAEAAKEIQNEIETELVGETLEEQAVEELDPEEIDENAEEQATNDNLAMEHKENDLEKSFDTENKPASIDDTNSEQEMIGVVMEEPETINAINPVSDAMNLEAEESEVQPAVIEINNENVDQSVEENMDLKVEESEIEPAVIDMNNETQDQVVEQSESQINEALDISKENEKIEEQQTEILENENDQINKASLAVENVMSVEEGESEIEKNDNIEEYDDVAKGIEAQVAAGEESKVTEETKTEFSNEIHNTNEQHDINQAEAESSPINEFRPDDEAQAAVEDTEKISNESQAVGEQQQEIETEIADKTAVEKVPFVEAIQLPEEIQSISEQQPAKEAQSDDEGKHEEPVDNSAAVNNETDVELKPEEIKPNDESVESQIVVEADTAEEIIKPVEDVEQIQAVDDAIEIQELKPVEEIQQDIETDAFQNDKELSTALVMESQVVEDNQNLKQPQGSEETQADQSPNFEQPQGSVETQAEQSVEESEHVEFDLPLEEAQIGVEAHPAKEIETMEEDQVIEEEPQTALTEIQAIAESQSIENVQPTMVENQTIDEVQPMDEAQTEEEAQSVQSVEEAEPIKEVQSMAQAEFMNDPEPVEEVQVTEKEETQTIDEFNPVEEGQASKEDQPIEKTQTDEETKLEENTEANHLQEEVEQEEESQNPEEIQANKDSQDVNIDHQGITEKDEIIETATETERLAEEVTHTYIDNQSEQQVALVTEANVAADIFPDELVPISQENQETTTQTSVEELIDNDKNEDKQNEKTQTIVLADENILQNVDTVEEDQKDNKQEEKPAAEQQKPLEDKDSDNKLNDDTNKSEINNETTSMLTTIVQVPTKEELTQQQPAEIVVTTLKPFNVLDSVLNYVNASFINNNNNNNHNHNDIINEEVKGKDEQAFSSKLRRYDGAQVWRIVVQNDREKKLAEELQTKYDGQLWKEIKQEVDYLLKPHVLADAERHVQAANLTRIVLIDNLQKVIEVENPPAEEIAQLQNRKGHRLTWQAYHRLEDIHGFFDYLAKTYPDICSVETIGYSIEKRPLKILKVCNGNANNTGIWIDGGMHAREWISPAVVSYIANQIVEGWDDLPAYMRNINWYIHAVANPDGYEYSHTTDRLWRKNMRSHGRVCPGVDLNRNFGYKWGGKGTSANPCAQTYRGSKAFSEPETFYISKFISNFPRDTFKAYLSFHSYGQYILYPWGYDYHVTKDMADLDLVARQAGTIITKSTGAKFTVGSSANTLYPAAGGSDDWAKGIAGIKYSYTIEMGDTGRYGFVLPADHIEPNGKNGLTFVETVAKAITMGKNARRRKLKARNKFH